MTPRFKLPGVLGLLLLAPALFAQAQPAADGPPAAARESGEERSFEERGAQVSLRLLEFLGEFTTEDGEWVDPAILMDGDIVESSGTAVGPGGQGRDIQQTRAQDAGSADNCVEPRCRP